MLPKYILCLALVLSGMVTACTSLHRPGSVASTEPCDPYFGPIVSGHVLYGTTDGNSVIFKVNTDGTSFKILHRFSVPQGASYTNLDGTTPTGLVFLGDTLYGTAANAGQSNCGTIFRIKTDGSAFGVLHSFTGSDGSMPQSGMILSDGMLYGTAARGGDNGNGTVFKLNPDGTGFTTVHSFAAAGGPDYTNLDGRAPSGLVASGNVLFGSAYSGGKGASGTVFRVNTDGSGFAVLHEFASGALQASPRCYTNRDGGYPNCGLVLLGHDLYGAAPAGGPNGLGTIFKVGTDGTGFAVLHFFSGVDSDHSGAGNPARMIFWDDSLYGTPSADLGRNSPLVFKISPDGTGFTWLPFFANTVGLLGQVTGLAPSTKEFYGSTMFGGTTGGGFIFKCHPDGTGMAVIHNFIEKWRVDGSVNPGMSD